MTDPRPAAPAAERAPWTMPMIEEAGTIHDIGGGAMPGLDGTGMPAHS